MSWKPSMWHRIPLRHAEVVIPEHDIHPHGKVIGPGEYQLDSYGGADCPCKPEIITGDMEHGMYEHPLVVHNSFENKEILQKSLASNYPDLLE